MEEEEELEGDEDSFAYALNHPDEAVPFQMLDKGRERENKPLAVSLWQKRLAAASTSTPVRSSPLAFKHPLQLLTRTVPFTLPSDMHLLFEI